MIFGFKCQKTGAGYDPRETILLPKQNRRMISDDQVRSYMFSGVAISDVGCVRPNNEDNYILGRYMNEDLSSHSEASVSYSCMTGSWQFTGVFDGMGGGEMGELASHDTAQIFLNAFGSLCGTPSRTEVDLCIRRAFLEANNRILDLQNACRILGTTGTVFCTNGSEFKIYHLGDSRAYRLRGREMLPLTKDQTLAQMKQDMGMYPAGEPLAEADKHKLTEYIGRDWTRENIKPVESDWTAVKPGDCVLLCSDGLYDMCNHEEIHRILEEERSVDGKAAALVQRAISNGGEDNITCVVVMLT